MPAYNSDCRITIAINHAFIYCTMYIYVFGWAAWYGIFKRDYNHLRYLFIIDDLADATCLHRHRRAPPSTKIGPFGSHFIQKIRECLYVRACILKAVRYRYSRSPGRSFTVLTTDIPRHIYSSNSGGIRVFRIGLPFFVLCSFFFFPFCFRSLFLTFFLALPLSLARFVGNFYTRAGHRRIKTKQDRFTRMCFCGLGQQNRAKSTHAYTLRFHGSVEMAQ